MKARKYLRLGTHINEVMDSNTIIGGDFNSPLTSMDKSSRQKINKETLAFNDTLDQMDLRNIFRASQPKTAEYIFSSNVHGTFSRIEYKLGYKKILKKLKRTEFMPFIFSEHNIMKLERKDLGRKTY